MHFGIYMSRKKVVDLRKLRDRLRRAHVTSRFLAVVLRTPPQRVEECLNGTTSFTYSQLLSIADLIGCEIPDLMS